MRRIEAAIWVHGKRYENPDEVAKAYGVTRRHVLKLRREGTIDKLGKRYVGKPITIRGVTYKSQVEAAKAIGVAASCIWLAKTRGTLDRAGLGRAQTGKRCRSVETGKEYPSIIAAQRELKFPWMYRYSFVELI